MSTNYKIFGVPEEDLYVSKTKEEKEQIRKEMVKMALEREISQPRDIITPTLQ